MYKVKLFILKSAISILRIFGKGSSVIGLLDTKLKFNILKNLEIKVPVIFIIGTNGKTTTSNLLKDSLQRKYKVVNNSEGANLLSGIKTTLISNLNYSKQINGDYIVLEVDEYTVPKALELLVPDYVVVTNFFRDQLDRYGEIDIVIDKIVDSISKTSAQVILNGNDPLIFNTFRKIKNKKIYYGVDRTISSTLTQDKIVEMKYCPDCNNILEYDFYHYGHIGKFSCPCCPFNMPNLDGVLTVSENVLYNKTEIYNIPNVPTYFYFNIAGVLTSLLAVGEDVSLLNEVLPNFTFPKGRSQTIIKGDTTVYFNLAKNVVGFEETLEYMNNTYENYDLLICFNDNYADGLDVSWIWDTQMSVMHGKVLNIHIVGERRYDMALRFELEGFEKITVCDNFAKGVNDFLNLKSKTKVIITNYTPLHETSEIVKGWKND